MQEMQETLSSTSELGRFPGEEYSNLLQYSCLGNTKDRVSLWATVHGGHKELDMTEKTHM